MIEHKRPASQPPRQPNSDECRFQFCIESRTFSVEQIHHGRSSKPLQKGGGVPFPLCFHCLNAR